MFIVLLTNIRKQEKSQDFIYLLIKIDKILVKKYKPMEYILMELKS